MPAKTPARIPRVSTKLSQLRLKLPRTATKNWLKMLVTFFTAFTITIIALRTWQVIQAQPNDPDSSVATPSNPAAPDDPGEPNYPDPESPAANPDFVDLQPIVDQWLTTTQADVGLMIYDLDHDQVAASHQPDKVFSIASVYKLFFAYSGYRQIDQNPALADQHYVTTSDYRADRYTFGQCLDLIVRESYNGCADRLLTDREQFRQANALRQELGLAHTSITSLTSTADDLTTLMRFYWQHADLSDVSWQKLADSMLNQPTSVVDEGRISNWRAGIPSGFSQAKVYDKVGWQINDDDTSWLIYNDVALLEFTNPARHYSLVVLTSGLESASYLRQLGRQLEAAILADT